MVVSNRHSHRPQYYRYYLYTHLTASFPGESEYAATRKVKPVWI